jgi:hypothetical protein
MMRKQRVETTLGNLIVALTEEAAPFAHSERELYSVVAVALRHLLATHDRGGKAEYSRVQVDLLPSVGARTFPAVMSGSL